MIIAATWVLIMTFGNGYTSQKIEGYSTEQSCRDAAKYIIAYTNDKRMCIPSERQNEKP